MPIGDAKPFEAGNGNVMSSVAAPLVNSAGKVVSAVYTARKKAQQAREAQQPEYVSTKESTAHGDAMREQVAARRASNQKNQNLSAAQHGAVSPAQVSPAGARKDFNQRRVVAAQAAGNQRRPLTPAQQKAAGMTRRAQG